MLVAKERVNHRSRRVGATLRQIPLISTAIIGIFVVMAIFADWLMPHNPYDAVLPNRLLPPLWQPGGSLSYPLGADSLGRDILSRIILGARVSLGVALASILVGGGIGTLLGLVAGYYGKKLDSVIMRAADVMIAFPIILLAVLLAVVLGPSFQNLIIIIGLFLWAPFSRLVRGEVLSWKTRDFVAAAKVAGASHFWILLHHILPNVLNSVVVMATLQVGYVILMEAALSFLGAGVPPPTPTWGSMVAEGRGYIGTAWWVSVSPGLAILLIVLAFNLFGDGLRDTLDPKLRQV